MKKIIAVVLAIFTLFAFAACNGKSGNDGNENNTLDAKVTIRYYADASAMLPAMKTGQLKTGLLPEPAATKITTMNAEVGMKIDVQEVYGGDYPQAVIVAKKEIVEKDGKFLSALLQAIEENASWIVANDDNAASAVDAINSALAEGVTPSLDKTAINKAVVENCNIYLQTSADAKTSVNAYLAAMKGVEDTSANAVSDAFFCELSSADTEDTAAEYAVYMPDGAPALAMAKLIKDNAQFERKVEYTVVSSANIGPSVVQEKADVAVLPVTAASKTVGNGEKYVMLGVVTHGNIYVMSSEAISSLGDLKGKTIGVIGQGQVPDLTFRYLLNKNDISYEIAK